MSGVTRPHVLGVDDGPFEKHASEQVVLVGVMMEGCDLVEAVATTRFPKDGAHSTEHLAEWIGGLRCRPALQALLFGGITIAGLGVIDVAALAQRLALPVLVVNRRRPSDGPLCGALRSAGLEERIALVRAAPEPFQVGGLWVSAAGIASADAGRLLATTCQKSELPEPLRLAHLIARAVTHGESRGRP